jgi:hypothetical protein
MEEEADMKVPRFFPDVLLLIVIALFAACGNDDEGDPVTSTNENGAGGGKVDLPDNAEDESPH